MYHNTLIIISLKNTKYHTLNIRSMTQHRIKLTQLNIELNMSVKKRQGKEEKIKEHSFFSLFKSCIFMKDVSILDLIL